MKITKRFLVKKIVEAPSIASAIRKEKQIEVIEITEIEQPQRDLPPAIGFSIERDDEIY